MAAKVVAMYKRPADTEAFEKRYFEGHMPLVYKFPNLRRVEIARGVGEDAPYYLMTEMYFDSVDAMRESLQSPEMVAARVDAREFASDIITVVHMDVVQSGNV